MSDPSANDGLSSLFVQTMSGLFECLGRALICLDRDFITVHASDGLDGLTVDGAAAKVVGRPVQEFLGAELFGEQGQLRKALEAGERREGWGASFSIEASEPRLLSITVAPIGSIDSPLCDPRVAYLLVVRGAQDPSAADTAAPTMFAGLVGRSTAMLSIFKLIHNLSESDATVLLTGESGTGKELVARALHVHSPRRKGPFVAVNCGALPGELLESELFGHVRGAFTGAVRDRVGRFEMARGGTLFLDEVADIALPLQVKLLRVLQEREFERVGESRARGTDARIIAATNRDLQRAILEGELREDLYYRLRVVPIAIPSLRERREDIEPLARHLLGRVTARHGRSMILGPDALKMLLAYEWPGNVRELENALEYAVAVCKGQTIHAGDLPVELQQAERAPSAAMAGAGIGPSPDSSSGMAAERDRLRAALDANQWSRTRTAKTLGMSRSTLWRRMRELGLTR